MSCTKQQTRLKLVTRLPRKFTFHHIRRTRLGLHLPFPLEISSAIRWFYLGWFSFLSFLFSFFLFPTRIDTTILSQLRALQGQFIPSTRNRFTNCCSHLVNPPKFFTVSLIKEIPSKRNFHTFAEIDCDYRVSVQSNRGIRRESMETRNKSSICRSIEPTLDCGIKGYLQARHTCTHTHIRLGNDRIDFQKLENHRIYFPSKYFCFKQKLPNKRSKCFFVCQ